MEEEGFIGPKRPRPNPLIPRLLEAFPGAEIKMCWAFEDPGCVPIVLDQGDTDLCSIYATTNCMYAYSYLTGDKIAMRPSIQEISDRLSAVAEEDLSIRQPEKIDYDVGVKIRPFHALWFAQTRGVFFDRDYPLLKSGAAMSTTKESTVLDPSPGKIFIEGYEWNCIIENDFHFEVFKKVYQHPILGVAECMLEAFKNWDGKTPYNEDKHQRFLVKAASRNRDTSSSLVGSHTVLIVGYLIYRGRYYYIIQNSYGSEWGIDGYGIIGIECFTQAGWPTGWIREKSVERDFWEDIKRKKCGSSVGLEDTVSPRGGGDALITSDEVAARSAIPPSLPQLVEMVRNSAIPSMSRVASTWKDDGTGQACKEKIDSLSSARLVTLKDLLPLGAQEYTLKKGLTALANAFHALQPLKAPGFRYYNDCSRGEANKKFLSTRTTATSSRMLYPIEQKLFAIKRYYYIDRATDRTPLAEFHQTEGIICNCGLTLGHLIGVFEDFFTWLGTTKVKTKPAYNPYTNPSMEIFSYHEGFEKWVEIGSSTMFRPEMLELIGLPEEARVNAWDLLLERPTMILCGIDSIRDLFGLKIDNLNSVCLDLPKDLLPLEAQQNTLKKELIGLANALHALQPVKAPGFSRGEANKNILSTHTTATSSRMLYQLAQKPFTPKRYYKIDHPVDRVPLAEFHQIEGIICNWGLVLGDLIGVFEDFFTCLGMAKLKFKPTYNPYMESNMEIFSYHEGFEKWVEIGNSGMFRPEMLELIGLPVLKMPGLLLERWNH